MSQSLGGRTLLTSNGMLLFYYAAGLLSFVLGFSALIALVGAIISGMVAKKEGATAVYAHCKWISRTVWINILFAIGIILGGLYLIGFDLALVEAVEAAKDWEAIMAIPNINALFMHIMIMIALLILFSLWYIYRMVRGAYKLIQGRAPKG